MEHRKMKKTSEDILNEIYGDTPDAQMLSTATHKSLMSAFTAIGG